MVLKNFESKLHFSSKNSLHVLFAKKKNNKSFPSSILNFTEKNKTAIHE